MAEDKSIPNPLPMPLLTIEKAQERRKMMREWIDKYLEAGVDKGEPRGKTNPNASKEAQKKWALLKPGAQKLAEAFGLRSAVKVTFREITPTRIVIEAQCDIYDPGTGEVLSSRAGVCSTDEQRYDYQRKGNLGEAIHNVQAMAAKRAFVEAVEAALAIGGIFSEDDDDAEPINGAQEQRETGSRIGQPARAPQASENRPDAASAQAVPDRVPNADRVAEVRESLMNPEASDLPAVDPNKCSNPECLVPINDGEKAYSMRIHGRHLCRKCQPKFPKLPQQGGNR